MLKRCFAIFLGLACLFQLLPVIGAATVSDNRTEGATAFSGTPSATTDLLFDFSNNDAAKSRYNSKVYGYYNFDTAGEGYWATGYNGTYSSYSISNTNGTLRMNVTDGYSGSEANNNKTYGPWLKVTNTYGKLPSYTEASRQYYPLNYNPSQAENIQIRFMLSNCQVPAGKTARVVFEFYYTKGGTYSYENDVRGEFTFQNGTYQILTIPLSDAFKNADSIKGFGLRFQNVYSTASNGALSVDYIYIGKTDNYIVDDYANVKFQSQMTTVLTTGLKETSVRLTNRDNEQVTGFFATVSPSAKVTMKASYPGYYTEGSTESSRKEKATNLTFQGARPTVQAAAYEKATGQEVYLATTGNFLNGETFQSRGYLVMEGNIVQTFYSLKTPYLAVLKDGSFAIRPYGTPLGDVQEAISGYQWLVRNGKIATDDDSERHPRTSVGLKADGTLVVFVVDGRKEGYSAGMTFVELADIMLAAGCVDAINLDGGGSATFASTYQGTTNLELRNQPSDETGERVLGAAMFLVPTDCRHSYKNATYTINGDGTHSSACTSCGKGFTSDHRYTNGVCVCGAVQASNKGLFFGFSGSAEDVVRYINPEYGYYNFDLMTAANFDKGYWATAYNGSSDAFVVDNASGTLTMDVTEDHSGTAENNNVTYGPWLKITNGYGTVTTGTSQVMNPLEYDPKNVDYLQIRFKLTNCTVPSGKTPKLFFEYYYLKDGVYKTGKDMSATYSFVDGEYLTVKIPASEALKSADTLCAFGLRFQHIKSASKGKLTVDYIYLGEKSADSLYFDFKNDAASKARYADVAYGFTNFDTAKNGYWSTAYNGSYTAFSVSHTAGVLNLTVTDGHSGTEANNNVTYGPWLKTTNTYGKLVQKTTYDYFPLSYNPSQAEYIQIRLKHTNCEVPEGKTPRIVFESYQTKDGVYSALTNMMKTYSFENGVYQTLTFPVSEEFKNSDVVGCIGLRFQNIKSSGKGNVAIDYIYIGPMADLPGGTCQVTFADENGKVLESKTVLPGADVAYSGETPTKPADVNYHYEFIGWDRPLTNIAKDVTFIAQFDPINHSFVYENAAADTHTGSCSCGYAVTENHSYADGLCVCGAVEITEAVLDANLTFGAQLYLENDLTMAFRVKADKLSKYDISTAYLVVEREVYETGAKEATVITTTITEATLSADNRYVFSYPGIAAAQMNDAITATLHIKDAKGQEYVSPVLNTSVATYLDGLLTASASDAKLVTLVMDMVNYGAAAQVYFDRHADAPVNEAFDSFKTYASYASADFKTALENLSATENAEGKSGKLNLSLDLGTRIGIQYKVTVPADVNAEDVTLVVTDANGNVLETLKVAGNATDSRGRYLVNFYGSTSRDMRRVVYATAYANGEAITGTYAYSISSYAWGVQENAGTQPADLVNVTRAMLLYGDSAAAYFG